MTTSRNDFETPDTPSSSIDSAAATSGAGDGGSNRSDSGTAQTEPSAADRPGLLTRAAGGPTRAQSTICPTAAGSPSKTASTVPSGRLRTQQATVSERAW